MFALAAERQDLLHEIFRARGGLENFTDAFLCRWNFLDVLLEAGVIRKAPENLAATFDASFIK